MKRVAMFVSMAAVPAATCWGQSASLQILGPTPACESAVTQAIQISGDGSRVVGQNALTGTPIPRTFGVYWDPGLSSSAVPVGPTPPDCGAVIMGQANGASSDGILVVGEGGTTGVVLWFDPGVEYQFGVPSDFTSAKGIASVQNGTYILVNSTVNPDSGCIQWPTTYLAQVAIPTYHRMGPRIDIPDPASMAGTANDIEYSFGAGVTRDFDADVVYVVGTGETSAVTCSASTLVESAAFVTEFNVINSNITRSYFLSSLHSSGVVSRSGSTAISVDGEWITGWATTSTISGIAPAGCATYAMVHNRVSGQTSLLRPPGGMNPGTDGAKAMDVSRDGETVVGYMQQNSCEASGDRAFVAWQGAGGAWRVQWLDLWLAQNGVNMTDITLERALAVSDNGAKIVGTGHLADLTPIQWVATIPTPTPPTLPTCNGIDFNNDCLYPDTDDEDDFLTAFSGNSNCQWDSVDFNADGLYPDTDDIACFLTVFSGGTCPSCITE